MSYGICPRCKDGNLSVQNQGKRPESTHLYCPSCERVFVQVRCEHCDESPYLQMLTMESNALDTKLRCPNCKKNISYRTLLGGIVQAAPAVIAIGLLLRLIDDFSDSI